MQSIFAGGFLLRNRALIFLPLPPYSRVRGDRPFPLPSNQRMDSNGPYAVPRTVTDPADCYFYHTMEIPGHGLVEGEWDLRPGVEAYLGGIDFRGKRVLEVGTASGFLCFQMEARGAEVVAFDL